MYLPCCPAMVEKQQSGVGGAMLDITESPATDSLGEVRVQVSQCLIKCYSCASKLAVLVPPPPGVQYSLRVSRGSFLPSPGSAMQPPQQYGVGGSSQGGVGSAVLCPSCRFLDLVIQYCPSLPPSLLPCVIYHSTPEPTKVRDK